LLDKYIEDYAIMSILEEMGFKDRSFGGFPQGKEDPKTTFGPG
jgi:hypothetical protein